MSTQQSLAYGDLAWAPSIAADHLCGFASFVGPMQALLENGDLSADNPLVRLWQEELTQVAHRDPRYRAAAALKAAYAKTLLADDAEGALSNPFDLSLELVLSHMLGQPGENLDPYYADFIAQFLQANLDRIRTHHENFTQLMREAYPGDDAINLNDGVAFLRYLKQVDPNFLKQAKAFYCEELVKPRKAFMARANDIVYIARQLECFSSVVIHHQFANDVPTLSERFELQPTGAYELNFRNKCGSHWEAAYLPFQRDIAPETAVVPTSESALTFSCKTLLALFEAQYLQQPKISALLQNSDSELARISFMQDEYIERTSYINDLLEEDADPEKLNRELLRLCS